VSSLFELTAEETSFLSVLVMNGQELWGFLGAPLVVTLAQNAFLPVGTCQASTLNPNPKPFNP
jgi:hypothetical protein